MTLSRRCLECKRRKIKCDGAAPECEKCSAAGRGCPGYPDELELTFRDMTVLVGKRVESRVQKVLQSRDQSEQVGTGLGLQAPLSSVSSDPRPCLAVASSWEEDAISRFCADYMMASNVVTGNINCLSKLYATADAYGCLRDAFHATAIVSQANQLGLEWMTIEATNTYGRALASLVRALKDPVEAKKDTTLAAIYMVGMYEFISGNKPTGVLMDQHHHQGRMLLLRLRGDDRFSSLTPTSRCLYSVVVEQAIIKCINRHEMPSEEIKTWIESLDVVSTQQQVARLHFLTAQLAAEAQVLFDDHDEEGSWENSLREIIDRADRLDFEYQEWIDRHSQFEPWRYKVLPPPTGVRLPESKMVHVYHDIWVAYVWVGCRSKRAHLQEVLVRCRSLLSSRLGSTRIFPKSNTPGAEMDQSMISKMMIENMVLGICSSVPYILGEVDASGNSTRQKKRLPLGGYLLVWPLHVALTSTAVGSETEVWIRERLQFIDQSLGIRLGGLVARRERKEPWNLS